jgi:hypothetical protein
VTEPANGLLRRAQTLRPPVPLARADSESDSESDTIMIIMTRMIITEWSARISI